MRQGDHGESLFQEMCLRPSAITDVTLNTSAKDLHGWDFVADICPPVDITVPADLRPGHFQAFCQIKTTRNKPRETRVKLTNAVKAARSPLPFFVFLVYYPTKQEPELYGLHFWSDQITEALREARRHGNSGETNLHKRKVVYKFSNDDRVLGSPGDWMMENIRKHGGDQYGTNKSTLSRNVGYDGSSHEGTFNIGPALVSDIVSHEIGLLESLPFNDLKVFDTRFGIKSRHPTQVVKSGRYSVENKGKPVELHLFGPHEEEVFLHATGYSPISIGPDHPEFKFRVAGKSFQVIISPKREIQRYDISIDESAAANLQHQRGLLSLICWCGSEETRFSVECDIGELCSGRFNRTDVAPPWADHLLVVASHACEILGSEKSLRTVVTLADLWQLAAQISATSMICRAGSTKLVIPGSSLPEFDELVGYFVAKVGEFAFGAVYSFPTRAHLSEGESGAVFFSKPDLVRSYALKCSLEEVREKLMREMDQYVHKSGKGIAMAEGGDLTRWITRTIAQQDVQMQFIPANAIEKTHRGAADGEDAH